MVTLLSAALLAGCGSSEPLMPDVPEAPPPIFQEGNDRPTINIVPKRFRDLADNRLGDMFPLDRHQLPCPPAEQGWSFTHVGDLSLKWVRLSVDVLEWETARDARQFSQTSINPCQDEVVSALAANGITILHTIVHWDRALHSARPPDYRNEEEIQLYLDYTLMLVRQFKGRVRYYEILNEAEVYVGLPEYLELVRRVVPVIRTEDPEAKIVVGGSSNIFYSGPLAYLFGVLRSDVMPLVDGIATHPMYGSSPLYPDLRAYYYGYPELVQEIKATAAAHGFVGEFFAEEMVWRTALNPNPLGEPFWKYSAVQAAKYYARVILINRGMVLWTGVGGEMYDQIWPIPNVMRNLGTVLGGATPEGQAVEIRGTGPERFMSFGFALPGGERLIAVWANGIAVDQDPGVKTTLAFPGLAGRRVVGVDPLRGLEQELTVESQNDALVVRDLLVRDYPLFLRLGP